MTQAVQPHILYSKKWVLVKYNDRPLQEKRRELNAPGEYLVCYGYVDHTAGLSLKIQLFCTKNLFGKLKKTGDTASHSLMYILRYGEKTFQDIRLLTADEIKALELPDKPPQMEIYDKPLVEPLRSLDFLHPLRAPGFPDDIKFLMTGPVGTEVIWGRLERRIDEKFFECELLNQPKQNFGVNVGDRVVVKIFAVAKVGIKSEFVGPIAAFGHLIDLDTSPPSEKSN